MKKNFFNWFLFVMGLGLSMPGTTRASERVVVIENPADRAVYSAYSVETADEVITEGFWQALPKEEMGFDVPQEGKLSLRVNFESEIRNPLNLPGSEKCGSLTEKFKSIVKKSGTPEVIFYSGEGDVEGFATKKAGKTCEEAGGVLLKGFHEAVPCRSGVPGEMCFPFSIIDTNPSSFIYVNACNRTQFSSLYVVLRFFEENEWRSEGWFNVDKNQCRKLGPYPTDKALYAVATTSSYEANYREWTPEGTKVMGCMNPSVGFLYAEKADGTCEARDTLPEDAPASEKIEFAELVAAGVRGIVEFNLVP